MSAESHAPVDGGPEADAAVTAAAHAMDRLGWCIDRRDWPGVTATLADTVTLDYTAVFGGAVETVAGAEVVSRWQTTLGGLAGTQHVITGAQLVTREGARLGIVANVVATHVASDGRLWTIGGWYEAALLPSGSALVVAALTLHPTWETGTREILS